MHLTLFRAQSEEEPKYVAVKMIQLSFNCNYLITVVLYCATVYILLKLSCIFLRAKSNLGSTSSIL